MIQSTTYISQLQRYLAELSLVVDSVQVDDAMPEQLRDVITWEYIRLVNNVMDAIASITYIDDGD